MKKINFAKLIEYLLYLFVFLLPWQTRWIVFDSLINGEVWEYGRIAIYGFDIIFIVLSILYLVFSIKRNWKLVISNCKFVFVFLCFCVFLILSILFISDHKILSLYWSLRILQGVLLIWLLSKINFSKVKMAWAFVISMTLSAGLAIYQFLTQSTFASKWLGLAYHSARVLGDSVIEFADQRWLRAYGSFPHPNILAGFLVLAIVLCFWLFSKTQDSINNKQEKKNFLLLYYPIILLLITALFFTFSRAAWIALIVLSIWYLVFSIKKYKLLNCYIVKLLVVSCLLLVILSIMFWPLVKTRVVVEERLEIKSNIERISGYKESFEIIKNNLWLGVGIGNYTNELQKINPDLQAWDYQPVHNMYLLILAELGVFGILIITLLLCYFIKLLFKKKSVLVFLCFSVFMFLFLWDHFWWTLASGMLIVFLSLGFICNSDL